MARHLLELGLVAVLALAVAWVAGDRFLLRRVNALVLATKRLGSGDPSARTGLPHSDGELSQLARAFDDMAATLQTRQAEAEHSAQTLRRFADRLKALREIDQGILKTESPDAIAHSALHHISDLIPCRRVSLVLFDFEANEVRIFAAHDIGKIGPEPGTRIPLELLGDIRDVLKSLREGKTHVLDLQALPNPSPVLEAVRAQGVRATHIVPLIVQGQLIGAMSLGLDSPDGLAPEHIDIAREVADQLAVAIHQAGMREDLRRHAADLEQRVSERTADLREANQEADRANQAKSEFLSRMSHELRTPLNAVLGFAQLLEMDSLNPEQLEAVGHILKGGRHLLELINEVLDIARIEAGRLSFSLEPVPVKVVLQETLDLIAPLAAEEDIRLTIEADSTPERHVLADGQRMKQVLLNLLANAVKYNRKGGRVALSYQVTPEGRLRIKVSDTGPGIAPERMKRLFIPFERLGAEQTGIEGTGLGLALSKRIVEAMGGTLGVESTAGQGSTFWIELALVEGPVQRLERENKDVPSPADIDPSKAVHVVLYIEDNLSNLKLVQRLIGHRPEVRLIPAMQGQVGLDLAREHHPHLILLDLQLPDVPGDEVLRRLQQDPETSRIPVVVISADATPGQIERLLAAGARDYLTKPLDVRKFLSILDETLAQIGPSDSLTVADA